MPSLPFYYTPYLIFPLLSAVINGYLAGYAWKRRNVPASFWFFLVAAGLSGWSLSYALNTAATELWLKKVFFVLGHSFFTLDLIAVLPMTLVLLGIGERLSPLKLSLVSVVPLVSLLISWTNELHGFMRRGIHLVDRGGMLLQAYQDGPYFSAHILYVYLYFLAVILLCLWGGIRRGQARRASMAMIALATLVPLITDMLHLSPYKELHLATSALFISGLFYWLAVFRHNMVDLLPVARAALFEQMQEPVLVTDLLGDLADMNAAARERLKIPLKALGRPMELVYPLLAPVIGKLSTGHEETIYDDAAGVWWHLTSSAARRHNRVIGYLLLLRDVTELQRAQDALRDGEERFRRLSDDSADIVWEMDDEMRLTYINQADRLIRGYAADEVLGRTFVEMVLEEEVGPLIQLHNERLEKERQGVVTGSLRMEVRMKSKGGNTLWMEVHSNPLRDDQGKITGYIGVTRDESRRKADEIKLNLRNKELEEALARVKTLEGIIPICMFCKKIRNEQQSWDALEKYISQHTDAMFSHGICPECFELHDIDT